jgi:hypothetical protein
LLDGHSKVSPVSIVWLIDEIRQNFETALSDDALELLAVEMVSTRHLPMKLDQAAKEAAAAANLFIGMISAGSGRSPVSAYNRPIAPQGMRPYLRL